MVVAGNPLMYNQCSSESAPFFVSTNTKVKACCKIINKKKNYKIIFKKKKNGKFNRLRDYIIGSICIKDNNNTLNSTTKGQE